jgi:hypothetical protein
MLLHGYEGLSFKVAFQKDEFGKYLAFHKPAIRQLGFRVGLKWQVGV